MISPIATNAMDSYAPVARIGSGGQAEILLAVQRGSGDFEKLVVIKRLWPHLVADEESRRRLAQEAQLVARLHHPNVCQVLNLIENEDGPLIVLEYLDGITFAQISTVLPKVRSRDDIRLIAGILQQACEGLHSAHMLRDRSGAPANLVHRDVSSGNIIITREGIVKVLDFGIAKASTTNHSRVATVRGTVPFMSPEQVKGDELDLRSDVFSLAVLAFEAVTGLGLYRRADIQATFLAIVGEDPPRIGVHQPAMPHAMEDVLRRALAKDREDRPASARELGGSIAEAVRELGGPMGLAEIAQIVESRFAETMSERIRQFESIRREAPAVDPQISRWTHETFSILPCLDLSALPASTMDLHSPMAAALRDPRSEPGLANATLLHATGGAPPSSAADSTVAPEVLVAPSEVRVPYAAPPRRRGALLLIALAVLFLLSAALIVLLPTDRPVAASAAAPPPAVPASAISPEPATPPDAATAEDATPADAAAVPAPEVAIAPQPPIAKPYPRPGRPAPTKRPRAVRPEPAAAPRVAPGFLTVDSRPAARISVDGRDLGQVPLYRIELAPGKHRMLASLEDGRKKSYTIEIRAGEDVRKRLTW